jgi:preprotein translocase subunit SecG
MSVAESGVVAAGGPRAVTTEGSIIWETKVRLIGNRVIVRDALLLLIICPGALFLLIGIPYGLSEGLVATLTDIGPLVLIAGLIFLILLVVTLVFLHVASRGGLSAVFVVNQDGVGFAAGSMTRTVNRAALAGSLLFRSLGGTGAAILAKSSERGFIRWDEVRYIRVYPRDRFILVRQKWLIYPIGLYCTEENFPVVLDLIRHYKPGAVGK